MNTRFESGAAWYIDFRTQLAVVKLSDEITHRIRAYEMPKIKEA
jgi:hypothetical protein